MRIPSRPTAAAKDRRRLQERVTAGLVFGLVGMLTGALSLYIAWRTTSEEAAVVVGAYPTASPADLTHAGYGVRVSLVNKSLRPVIIRDAALWVNGNRSTGTTGYLEDVRLLDRSSADPAAINEARLDFPLTLNAREGRAIVVLMDVWQPIVTAESAVIAATERHALNQFLAAVGSLPGSGEAGPIELELELAPGGSERFPVRPVTEPGVYPEAIRDATAIQRETPLQNWLVDPRVEGGRLVGLSLRRRFSGIGQVNLVQLDLWKERSSYRRTITRPIVGQQAELFVFPELPRGEYIGTFRTDDTIVAYWSFSLPWRERRCLGLNETAPVWCPQAAPERDSAARRARLRGQHPSPR